MPSAIQINFRVGGTDEIARGFRTVQQAADRLETRTRKTYSDEEKLAKQAAKVKEQEAAKLEKALAAGRAREERANDKFTKETIKASAKEVDEKIRAEERWAKQRATIQQNSAKLAYKLAEQEVRDAEAMEKRKADSRARFARATGGHISGTLGGLARGAVGLAGTALAVGGGFGIADAMQQRFALEKSAGLFSNQTSTMPGGRISTADIMSRSRAVGIANNVDPAQVAASMQAYFAKASDAKGAMGNAGLFAQLAKATGSDMTQIASVAGALRVQNPNLDEAGMKNMLLGIVGQTRKGAVDISDLVEHVPVITSTSSLYGGEQATNQRKLIGLSQVAMRTSGSSAEAASAVQRFGSDIASNTGRIKSHGGGDVKDASGNLKDPAEIVAQMLQASGGDIGKLKDMGVGRESMHIFEAELQTFKAAGGGAKGAAAVRSDVSQFTEGGYDEKSLAADVANVQSGAGEKFEAATKRVSDVIQEKLAPWLDKFADRLPEIVPKVEKFVDAMGSLADFFMENPFTGIGAVVLAAITKDLAAAAIGEGIKTAITAAMGGGGAGAAGGGAGLGGAALVGPALFGAMIMYGKNAADKDEANYGKEGASIAAADVANLTPAQLETKKKAAQARAAALQEELSTGMDKYSSTTLGGGHTGAMGEAEASMKFADFQKQAKQTQAYIEALTVAMGKMGTAAQGASTAAPNAPARNQPMSHPARGGTQ